MVETSFKQTWSFKFFKFTSIVLVSLVLFCFIAVGFLTLYLTSTQFQHKSSGVIVIIGTLIQISLTLFALKGLLEERLKWIISYIAISAIQLFFYLIIFINFKIYLFSVIMLIFHITVLLFMSLFAYNMYADANNQIHYDQVGQEVTQEVTQAVGVETENTQTCQP